MAGVGAYHVASSVTTLACLLLAGEACIGENGSEK
jgi:hypothetical protein